MCGYMMFLFCLPVLSQMIEQVCNYTACYPLPCLIQLVVMCCLLCEANDSSFHLLVSVVFIFLFCLFYLQIVFLST